MLHIVLGVKLRFRKHFDSCGEHFQHIYKIDDKPDM